MAIYSTQLIAVHDQPAVLPASFTVPPDRLCIVRDVDVYFGSSLATRVVYFEGSASQIIWQESVGPNLAGWRSWRGRQVFNPGDSFQVFATDVFDVSVSGYLLTPP